MGVCFKRCEKSSFHDWIELTLHIKVGEWWSYTVTCFQLLSLNSWLTWTIPKSIWISKCFTSSTSELFVQIWIFDLTRDIIDGNFYIFASETPTVNCQGLTSVSIASIVTDRVNLGMSSHSPAIITNEVATFSGRLVVCVTRIKQKSGLWVLRWELLANVSFNSVTLISCKSSVLSNSATVKITISPYNESLVKFDFSERPFISRCACSGLGIFSVNMELN